MKPVAGLRKCSDAYHMHKRGVSFEGDEGEGGLFFSNSFLEWQVLGSVQIITTYTRGVLLLKEMKQKGGRSFETVFKSALREEVLY